MSEIGQDLLNVPMGEMIRDMGLAIADAQFALDEAAMEVAEMMSGHVTVLDDDGKPVTDADGVQQTIDTRVQFGYTAETDPNDPNKTIRVPVKLSMMELGFAPNFYQFVDTIAEVKIAIRITRSDSSYRRTSSSTSGRKRRGSLFKRENTVQTTQVDAAYSRRYGYSAEGSSLLRTKLVPIPAPALLEERIRAIMDAEREIENAG